MDALSCTSVSSCFAVGTLSTEVSTCSGGCYPSFNTTLQIEHWDGRRWTRQRTPNPNPDAGVVGTIAGLTGVACTSDRACITVGPYIGTYRIPVALAEHWDGARWTARATPNPGGTTDNEGAIFNAVSCPAARTCIGVGAYRPISDVSLILVERWQHGRWTIQVTTPNVPGRSDAFPNEALESISCTSVRSCMAVGTTSDTDGAALAERWDGVRWTVEPIPTPPHGSATSGGTLYGVSCTSGTSCLAVGFYSGKENDFLLVERWDGRRWSFMPTPLATNAADRTGGISCTSRRFCMLVSGRRTESWDGARWTIVPTPDGTELAGVSCPSPRHCIAVGRIMNHGASAPPSLVETWNGRAWKITTIPTPVGTTDANLDGVSCPSPSACTAVGSVVVKVNASDSRQHTFAVRWTGGRWAMYPTPDGSQTALSGVSCTSSIDCVAVGSGGGSAFEAYGDIVAEGYP